MSSSTLARRRRPAVSMKLKCFPRSRRSESIASRVVPASGATTCRSSPSSRLTSDDLPAFGRPTTATLIALRSSSSIAGGQQLAPAVEQVAAPLPHAGRRRPPDRRSRAVEVVLRRGALEVVELVDHQQHRPLRLAAAARRWRRRSGGAPPCRPPRRASRSASAIAISTCCRIAWSIESCESGTRPPVSTSQNCRPFHSASPKWRSRVVPASVGDDRLAAAEMRLKSVDLPTLGRPTMATVGLLTRRGLQAERVDEVRGQPDLHRQRVRPGASSARCCR